MESDLKKVGDLLAVLDFSHDSSECSLLVGMTALSFRLKS